ncbi:MAG: SurA N-terminal domain-containing protein [Desulfobulbaceae bacterium]|nr:SurA N-terminal domain-containing protein [Desulfobulbaceae bacterium]
MLTYLLRYIIFALLFCTFNFTLASRAESAEIVDRIVAVVNDDIITLFELNLSFKPYADKIRERGYPLEEESKVLFKTWEDILNQLIEQKITDQEIKRFKISISEKEIDQTIERIKEANYYTDEDLRAALAKDGLTMEEYRKQVKEQILRKRLVNLKVTSKIVITEEDIKSYYETHKDKYGRENKYHLRNIIMKVSSLVDEKEKLEVKARMDEVYAKLKAGQSFETMAMNYSESLASEGGDLGLFGLSELSLQLQKAIKGMKAGEFTPVLFTDQGYQILFVQEIVNTSGKPLEEVSPEIERILFDDIVDNNFQSWLEDLRKQSHIKIIK